MNNENLTVHFKVKDFNAWRTSYNGHEKDRLSAGITNGRVFRSHDPNDVVILQDVADVSKARTWLTSNEMKSVMEERRTWLAQHPFRRCRLIAPEKALYRTGWYLLCRVSCVVCRSGRWKPQPELGGGNRSSSYSAFEHEVNVAAWG